MGKIEIVFNLKIEIWYGMKPFLFHSYNLSIKLRKIEMVVMGGIKITIESHFLSIKLCTFSYYPSSLSSDSCSDIYINKGRQIKSFTQFGKYNVLISI